MERIFHETLHKEEILDHLGKLKNNKSPGENKICAEIIKHRRDLLQTKMIELVQEA